MKPIIEIKIDYKALKEYIKYHGWFEADVYFRTFIEDCLLNIKVSEDNGIILSDKIKLDDKQRIR